jgi:hypothetical protein
MTEKGVEKKRKEQVSQAQRHSLAFPLIIEMVVVLWLLQQTQWLKQE